MANISNIKIGSTTYNVKDTNAAPVYDLSLYRTSTSVLPSDYYKANFHVSGEPVEMKYLRTNNNTSECSPLNTNTLYIVFALNRAEAAGYYWAYYVYTYSDKKYVGIFDDSTTAKKRPTILNKAFFNETNSQQIIDVVDDYYNGDSVIRSVECQDNIGIEMELTITDKYQNESGCTIPCATASRAGVMTKGDRQLISKTIGVQAPVDITSNIKQWLSDNSNGKDTTSTINSGSVITDIFASTESSSSIKINDYKILYFTITENTILRNGTNNTSWILYPGTYVCKQLDGYIPEQIDSDAYYTFEFVSNTQTQGGITVPKIATGFIHLVYKNTSSYVGWAIERVGKCTLSYATS